MSANSVNVVREIEEIHRFIEDWMAGRCPEQDNCLHRLEFVLHEDFTFVTSSGLEADRDGFLAHVRQVQNQCEEMRIWAENIRIICSSALFVVARFDEYEHDKNMARARVSTSVFEVSDGQPNGLSWLRLHETRKKDVG